MLRLNLGCGHKPLDGFVNIDGSASERSRPDVVHDLTQPLPYEDGSVDEVHSYHLIEHFDRWLVDDIVADWARVLKPGGLMVIECPCMDKVIALFGHFIKAGKPLEDRLTMWALYGDPNYREPAMMHKWCYPVHELREVMESAGLSVTLKEPQTHIKVRDMRLEGVKHGTNV